MGRHDLGKRLIMSEKDVSILEINLKKLRTLGRFFTPLNGSIFGIRASRKKSMKIVEEMAEKKDADLAVISDQITSYGVREHVSYEYSLYKYW